MALFAHSGQFEVVGRGVGVVERVFIEPLTLALQFAARGEVSGIRAGLAGWILNASSDSLVVGLRQGLLLLQSE